MDESEGSERVHVEYVEQVLSPCVDHGGQRGLSEVRCVVHEEVETAPLLEGPEEAGAMVRVAHVPGDRHEGRAIPADLVHSVREFRLSPGGDDETVPLSRQERRKDLPQPTARSGDECDLLGRCVGGDPRFRQWH